MRVDFVKGDDGRSITATPGYDPQMSRTISQRELRNDSGAIMRALDRGESFVVTRNGVPVGELRPVRRPFVARDRLVEALRDAPAIDPERFRDDVDRALDQDAEPRA